MRIDLLSIELLKATILDLNFNETLKVTNSFRNSALKTCENGVLHICQVGETGAHWDMGHNGTMGFPGKPPMGES